MRGTTTLILALVFVLCLFFVIKGRPPSNSENSTFVGEKASLPAFPLADITALSLDSTYSGKTEMAFGEKGWRMIHPLADRLNLEHLGAILKGFNDLKIKDHLPGNDVKDLKAFGLEGAELLTCLVTLKRKETHRLLFGLPGPFTDSVYVQYAGSKGVFVVEPNLKALLEVTNEEFRDSSLVRVKGDELEKVTVENADKRIELIRVDGKGAWLLEKPLQTRGSQENIEQMLTSVAGGKVKRFLDRPDEILKEGARKRSLQLQWVGNPDPTTIECYEKQIDGAETPRYFVHITGRGNPMEVGASVWEGLGVQTQHLRDQKLLRIEPAKIKEIVIELSGKEPLRLRQEVESVWFFQDPNGGNADQANPAMGKRLLDALASEEILAFVSDSANDQANYGLGPGQEIFRISLSGMGLDPRQPDKDGSLTLRFGKNDGQNDRVYVNQDGDPYIFAIDRAFLSAVSANPIKWKSLVVLEFGITAFRKLTVTAAKGRSYQLTHEPVADSWKIQMGNQEPSDLPEKERARLLVAILGTLNADQWIADRSEALAKLSSPLMTMDLELDFPPKSEDEAGEKRQHRLEFSPISDDVADPPFYYGRLDSSADPFLVSKEVFKMITGDLLMEK